MENYAFESGIDFLAYNEKLRLRKPLAPLAFLLLVVSYNKKNPY